MPVRNAQELFVRELGDIYDAEHRFLECQRELAEEASHEELKDAIQEHVDQTEQHIRNLERVFDLLGQEPRRGTSQAAQRMASEAQERLEEAESDAMRDWSIIVAVVKVEHFEMASYRSMILVAKLMRQTEILNLLNRNLAQEKETEQIVEQIAEQGVEELLQQV